MSASKFSVSWTEIPDVGKNEALLTLKGTSQGHTILKSVYMLSWIYVLSERIIISPT